MITYMIARAIGTVLILWIFIALAALIASKASWILYGVGIGVYVLAIIGNMRSTTRMSAVEYIFIIASAVLGFFLISKRIKKKASITEKEAEASAE